MKNLWNLSSEFLIILFAISIIGNITATSNVQQNIEQLQIKVNNNRTTALERTAA